jgi:hypothetical protein
MKTFLKEFVLPEKYFVKKIAIFNPLPYFKVVKTDDAKNFYSKTKVIEVENNEGSKFYIKDSITPINGINKGREFKILSFRYTKNLDNVCAITSLHTPNGIGIDKIEHFIEKKTTKLFNNEIDNNLFNEKGNPCCEIKLNKTAINCSSAIIINKNPLDIWLEKTKVLNLSLHDLYKFINATLTCNYIEIYCELKGYGSYKKAENLFNKWNFVEESLLEKTKRLYPVGTRFISPTSYNKFTVKNHDFEYCYGVVLLVFKTLEDNENGSFYACIRDGNGEWAEIIK